MTCDACGATNRAGAEFCVQCNAYLAWDGSQQAQPPTRPTAAQPGPAPESATPPTTLTPTVLTPAPVLPESMTATLPQPVVGPVGETCPTCWLVNAPGLRFCAHCGYGFASSVPEQPGAPAAYAEQSAAAADRAARRAYRRSLPPFYRWRRVLIGLLVAVLALAGALWVRHPVAAAQHGWYGVTRHYVDVTPLAAEALPSALTAAGSAPAYAVDGTEQAWTEVWQPTGGSPCGAAPGTAELVLTFAPTRVRQLQLLPGLPAANPRRTAQPQPKTIGVTFPGRPCQVVPLDNNVPAPGPVKVDSRGLVTSVRIGIGAVHGPVDPTSVVSITEVVLRSYPR